MAYLPIPLVAESDAAIKTFLTDLSGRKEFATYAANSELTKAKWDGYIANPERYRPFLPGLRLNGAQIFIRNFENPDTEFSRVLIKWQTGTGKSIAAISISHEFIKQFRVRASLGELVPTVFIISFTARETIQEDMLRYPEFGFVSASEVEELRTLRALASAMGPASNEARQLSGQLGVLRRRITDRSRGGYFQFYGYKEFANHLFVITKKGLEHEFDIQAIYSRSDKSFDELLSDAVKRGDITINEMLLNELRNGLLIADEIHNVYNILETNNYGIAIQYVLDTLGNQAPRAVFMSATPMTGSAAEVVDLLNLIVPRAALDGKPLRRSDFFIRSMSDGSSEDSSAVTSQLREGALDRIARLAAGRVSFLLDSDINSYPKRTFVGEAVDKVPYLRLILCPMSDFHTRTLAQEQNMVAGLAANAYTLYDMAFPNPEFKPDGSGFGLYQSGETPVILSKAPEDWRLIAGVIVEKGLAAGVSPGTYVISGSFLNIDRLHIYSTKFAKVVAATLEAVRAGPGKIMIYHHRVRMSGVLLIQEILRMNGFADETSTATDATICAICGIARATHPDAAAAHPDAAAAHTDAAAAHTYQPARFVVAHSDVDRAVMVRSIARFNASSNINGNNYRVIIGSKIVREGLNFRGVRHQFVTSLPTDYPTMVQVFGRVVRKDSHSDLPMDERNVKISVFVSTRMDGKPSPELQRYIDKGKEYLVIQEVERALHIYAIDGFANYGRIRAVLADVASIDALPYQPIQLPAAGAIRTATYLAYGHSDREVTTLAAICRVLFKRRPVWTYGDLWTAVRSGVVRGINTDPSAFDEGNFAVALKSLYRPAGEPLTMIVNVGKFYIIALATGDKRPILDIESYTRHVSLPASIQIRANDFIREVKSLQNWKIRLREFNQNYLASDATSTPELALVDYGAAFHYTLIQQLVTSTAVTIDDTRVRELYRRFRIAVTVADRDSASHDTTIIGYVTPTAVVIYDGTQWNNASHTEFNIGRRHQENDIVVGFVISLGTTEGTSLLETTSVEARFKIRPPIQKLRAAHGDVRNLARGAVCETRTRSELEGYIKQLRDTVLRAGITPQGARGGAVALTAKLDYASKFDRAAQKRYPSAGEMCDTIRLHLLALEEYARAPATGMTSGLRWLYLFNDRSPSITVLMEND